MNDGHGQLTVSSGIRETGDKYEVTLEIEEAHSWILVYLYLPLGKFSKEKKAAGWVDLPVGFQNHSNLHSKTCLAVGHWVSTNKNLFYKNGASLQSWMYNLSSSFFKNERETYVFA